MDAEARLDAAVGSVAEEAARLLEAFGRQTPTADDTPAAGDAEGVGAPDVAADDAHAEHVHVAMGDAETCTWCPVCRSVTMLRAVSPETLERLADLATAAATVLGDMAVRHTENRSAEGQSTPQRTRTEPIDVVDEEELS